MKGRRVRFYPLSVLLISAGYASYALSKAVFILCAIPVALLLTPFPKAKAGVLRVLVHRYLGFFTRTWLPLLRVYRILEITGLERARAAKPAVLVANHRSFMDAILLLGLLPGTGVVIKARDTRQLTYALLERHFDLVSLERYSLNSVSSSLDRSRALLAAGRNLLVFPEGTRARSGRLQPFNRLAFQLALASGAPIWPVIVHSTCPFMAKVPGSIFPRGDNAFRIRFLDLESPRPDDDADSLCDRVHRRMAQELKILDAGTVWEKATMPGSTLTHNDGRANAR